jgi:hypothetical protein
MTRSSGADVNKPQGLRGIYCPVRLVHTCQVTRCQNAKYCNKISLDKEAENDMK